MAGHSKWANIKHRKGAADAKKGKVTTKIVKEITIAVKNGGKDIVSNARLRLIIDKARENNISKDNIERAIKRGAGEIDGAEYVELRFEGYGINGAGIIVDCLTDNNVRTVAEVRHAFNKYNGSMGAEGSVAYQFKHCGQLIFAPEVNEDSLMDACLALDVLDVIVHEDKSKEVLVTPNSFLDIKNSLDAQGFKAELAEVIMRADVMIDLGGEDQEKMQRLIDALESLDDVQEVYTNANFLD